jgi:hypothetical protein
LPGPDMTPAAGQAHRIGEKHALPRLDYGLVGKSNP